MKIFDSLSFASLGSGSKGNGTLVAYGETCLLLDCGFTLKETEHRLQRLKVQPKQLNGILVTHEHGDHISGVGMLARKYDVPVYLTAGTLNSGRLGKMPKVEVIDGHKAFQIEDLCINPVPVPHDAREPVQYVFRNHKDALGVLTDLGSITPYVVEQYQQCDALLLEANHCIDMLARGPYPMSLKERVGGDWGHLSNEQCASLLRQLTKPLKYLVLAHLSEQNNHPDRVRDWLEPHLHKVDQVIFACQKQGTDWFSI